MSHVATGAARRFPAGRMPYRPIVPNSVLAVALLLVSEVMLFAGLASAHVVLRGQALTWPPPGQPRLPVEMTALNTLILLASGVTMWLSVPALLTGARLRMQRWLLATFVLGATFLLIQGYEWVSLLGYGLTRSSSLYGSLFYTLVGCHGLHVLGALVALGVLLLRALRVPGAPGADALRATWLYWSFVVLVWPPLYVLVYLW